MTATRRRAARLVAAALTAMAVAAVSVTTAAGPAAADDYGYSDDDGQGPVALHDSADHWYCFDASVAATWRPTIAGSMAYLDDATNLHDVASSSCGAATDVAWHQADLPGSIAGVAVCSTFAYWSVCDRWNVAMDPGTVFEATGTCGGGQARFDVNWIHFVRHELGHTVGLHHTAPTAGLCSPAVGLGTMTSDFTAAILSWTAYHPHHVDHVNCRCG